MNDNFSKHSVSIKDLVPIIMREIADGGTVRFTASGKSMLPLLLDRVSVVHLAGVSAPKRGDIVFYRRNDGTYILHRIIACDSDGTYTMCGDGQVVKEPGIKKEQILAVMTAFTRNKRLIDCTNFFYCVWWRLHIFLLPVRRLKVRAVNLLCRIISRIKRIKH